MPFVLPSVTNSARHITSSGTLRQSGPFDSSFGHLVPCRGYPVPPMYGDLTFTQIPRLINNPMTLLYWLLTVCVKARREHTSVSVPSLTKGCLQTYTNILKAGWVSPGNVSRSVRSGLGRILVPLRPPRPFLPAVWDVSELPLYRNPSRRHSLVPRVAETVLLP